jgi:Fe-S cluster assembly scaffold IscU
MFTKLFRPLIRTPIMSTPFSSTHVRTHIMSTPLRSYSDEVNQHFNKPKNIGKFNKNDPDVGTGLVGAPACGDVMKLQIRVDDEGKIIDTAIKVFGCASAISSSSLASELIKHQHLDDAVKITNKDIARTLSLPPVKIHCSMLAEDAIKAAVEDVKRKKKQK